MKNEFTPELIEKAKNVASAAEILALAKENSIDMTAEEAAVYYANLHLQTGKISDEELDNVAGGGCHGKNGWLVVTVAYSCDYWSCKLCSQPQSAHTSPDFGDCKRYKCPNGGEVNDIICDTCSYCSYQGTWYCTNPAHTS